MRKLICTILALAMLAAPAALADGATDEVTQLDAGIMTPADGVCEIPDNCLLDLDGDGTDESVSYKFEGDEYDDGTLTVTVDDEVLELELYSGIDALYAARLGGEGDSAIYLLAGEYGMSSDYCSYIMRYDENGLKLIGGIGALPEELSINGNVITATVRGNNIETWYRESDFVIAHEMRYEDDCMTAADNYYVAEVPRTYYAMNTAAVLKCDVEVKKSLYGTSTMTIKEGTTVVLTATDDRSYLYVALTEPSEEGDGGYLMLDEDNLLGIMVGGESIPSYEVFDGLIMAD